MTFTLTIHPKDNKSKATSSLFLFNMIAKLVMHTKTKTNTEPPQTIEGT